MVKKLRRAFTIVELVIVIAVIAILAAVLIPTFTSLIQKANVSNDTSLCRNLNTELAMDESENGKPESMKEVLAVLEKAGYKIDTLSPTANGYYYVWDKISNQILLVDENFTVEYSSKTYDVDNKEFWLAVGKEDTVSFALGEENIDGILFTSDYSGELDITRSLAVDTLDGAVINIVNINSSEALTAEVGGEVLTLNINAPSGEVTHTGSVKNVTITAVAPDSYVEKGSVTEVLSITTGHLKIEDGAKIERVVFPAAANNVRMTNAGTVALTEVEEGAQSVTIENSGSMGVFNNQTGETITITGNQPDANLDVSNLKTLPEVLGLAASGTAAEPAPATSYTISENVYIQLSEDFYFGAKTSSNTGVIIINQNVNAVIDLNGYDIMVTNHVYNSSNAYGGFIENRGTLSIIDTSDTGSGGIRVDACGEYAATIKNYGNLYLRGGSILMTGNGRVIQNMDNGEGNPLAYCEITKFDITVKSTLKGSGTNAGVVVDLINGTMKIGEQGKDNSLINFTTNNASVFHLRNNGKIDIYSGTFNATNSSVVYFSDTDSIFTVYGGAFSNNMADYFGDVSASGEVFTSYVEESSGFYVVEQVALVQKTVSSFADLKFYSESNGSSYVLKLQNSITLTENLTLNYGSRLEIPAGITLTIPENIIFTANGIVNCLGNIIVEENTEQGTSGVINQLDHILGNNPFSWVEGQSEYIIDTPFDLQMLAYSVNELEWVYLGVKIQLVNDLDLQGIIVPSIGQNAIPFIGGEFDGQGHTISNLSTITYKGNSGLFAWVAGVYLHDFTLENANIFGVGQVGGVVGCVSGGTLTLESTQIDLSCSYFENINFNGTVSAPGRNMFCAGIVGLIDDAEVYFINLNISGKISGSMNVGSIFGSASGNIKPVYIQNCVNSASVNAAGSIGMIFGFGYTKGNIYYQAFENSGEMYIDNVKTDARLKGACTASEVIEITEGEMLVIDEVGITWNEETNSWTGVTVSVA